MKKILLLISCLIISLSAALAADLNAYAYGTSMDFLPETNQLIVRWSLQAKASAVRIVLVDTQGTKYEVKVLGECKKENSPFIEVIDLSPKIDAGLLPKNEDLRVEIEVKTTRSNQYDVVGRKVSLQTTYSIDFDNNPYSQFFGLLYVTQMNHNKDRGVYVYDQWFSQLGGVRKDPDISTVADWYDNTHGVPHMVRVVQDGSGRLLLTSTDRSQDTHMWSVNPNPDNNPSRTNPELTDWKSVITTSNWKTWTGRTGCKFANAGLDIRENGDNWDILLYAATVDNSSVKQEAGYSFSGVYSVPKTNTDFTGGSYTSYTAPPSGENTHATISNAYTASMISANANFDKYGGVMYNASSLSSESTASIFRHRAVDGTFKTNYSDGDYLRRKYARTKGARFNQSFSKLAVAQGYLENELRIYDVTHTGANAHPSLSNGTSVNLIGDYSGKGAYVHDIAWDYAQNIFVSVRNYETINGVYVVATNLNGTPIITPVGGQPFQVACEDGKKYTISLNQSDGTGTLTGAGSYASCTEVTVTATADNQYKFVAWKEGSTVVSTSPTYTFYATKDRILTAVFEPAVYNNITWWNLFENGEDITSSSLDGTRNARLWYLFMPYYNNDLSGTSIRSIQSNLGSDYNVCGFCATNTKNTLENEDGMNWLGNYFKSIISNISWTNSDYSRIMYAFINRVNYAKNSSGSYTYKDNDTYQSNGLIAQLNVFANGAANPSQWRPYWTSNECNLPSTMTYNTAMPIGWHKAAGPIADSYDTYTTLPTSTSTQLTKTPQWYKWNNVDSEQNAGTSDTHILAWRRDGVKGPIITRVEGDNWKLYATYVRKHIHENDPPVDNSGTYPQDATNSDVFKLMYNKNWAAPWHNLTITRKIQGGMFNTVCFPFAVDLGDNGSMHKDNPFKNAEYWKYTGNTHSSYNESGEPVTIIEFVQETQRLQAGVPYLVKSDEDIKNEELLFAKEKVLIDTVPKTVSAMPMNQVKIDFIGTINPTTIPAGSLILVANNRLALTTAPGRMEGMRGYFYIHPSWTSDIAEQAADGRVYLSMKKPATTSIPVAPEAEQQVKPEVRKVMYDGKIYILRGEEVYTITGHRVR